MWISTIVRMNRALGLIACGSVIFLYILLVVSVAVAWYHDPIFIFNVKLHYKIYKYNSLSLFTSFCVYLPMYFFFYFMLLWEFFFRRFILLSLHLIFSPYSVAFSFFIIIYFNMLYYLIVCDYLHSILLQVLFFICLSFSLFSCVCVSVHMSFSCYGRLPY